MGRLVDVAHAPMSQFKTSRPASTNQNVDVGRNDRLPLGGGGGGGVPSVRHGGELPPDHSLVVLVASR